MPYILPADRDKYIGLLEDLLYELAKLNNDELGGHFNYCISYLMTRLWEDKPRYARINTLMGAVEGAKLEFYRFHVVPYEEEKRKENGDV